MSKPTAQKPAIAAKSERPAVHIAKRMLSTDAELFRDRAATQLRKWLDNKFIDKLMVARNIDLKALTDPTDPELVAPKTGEEKITAKKRGVTDPKFSASNLDHIRANTWRGRKIRSAFRAMIADRGGVENMSFAEIEIARRCAALSMLAAEMETALSLGMDEYFDVERYIVIARAQAQLFKQLGMKRAKKNVTPKKLQDYLKTKKARKARTLDGELDALED